jgi:hypothetical protein
VIHRGPVRVCCAADRGGDSPQSVSINSSVLTVRLARATRWASRARSFALGRASCPASPHTCSGPRTANSSFERGSTPGFRAMASSPRSVPRAALTLPFHPPVTAQSRRGRSRTCPPYWPGTPRRRTWHGEPSLWRPVSPGLWNGAACHADWKTGWSSRFTDRSSASARPHRDLGWRSPTPRASGPAAQPSP